MKLILNLDFGDVINGDPAYGKPYIGSPDGYYPEEALRGLIRKSVEAGFDTVYFRVDGRGRACFPSRIKTHAFRGAFPETLKRYDPLQVAAETCQELEVDCYAWMTPFDNTWENTDWQGRPKPEGERREGFAYDHPEYELQSRDGSDRLIGVFCFGYPEVQDTFLEYCREILAYPIQGLFFSDRTHSNLQMKKVEYGFNAPVIEAYRERFGGDPREEDHYDVERFSRIQGSFYTDFLRRVAEVVHADGKQLHVKASWNRGDRIAPRLGALHKSFFDWPTWVEDGVVDALVIGGDVVTGTDPEFLLPTGETESAIVNPSAYRARTERQVPLYRWHTLQSWRWEGEAERAPVPPYPVTFRNAVVEKAIHQTAESGVDGIQIHEAQIIPTREQWPVYQRFREAYPKS